MVDPARSKAIYARSSYPSSRPPALRIEIAVAREHDSARTGLTLIYEMRSEDGLDALSVAVLANVAARQRRAMPHNALRGRAKRDVARAARHVPERAVARRSCSRLCRLPRSTLGRTLVVLRDSENIGFTLFDA